jgi:hypothetical protein
MEREGEIRLVDDRLIVEYFMIFLIAALRRGS